MYNPLNVFLFLLVLVLLIGIFMRIFTTYGDNCYSDDLVEEHTVTTTTTIDSGVSGYVTVGNLVKQKDGTQFFVIDPVDQDRVWVNSTDDLYEDGKGQIWKLV
jgi:hypothetical protein